MERVIERRMLTATLIFNLEDSYARERLGPRTHPRPFEPLKFWLLARLAPGVREDYEPPREMIVKLNTSGYHLFFGDEKRPDSATRRDEPRQASVRRVDLAAGTYLIRVTSPLYQTVEQPIVVPMPNLNIRDPGNPDPAKRDPIVQYSFDLRPSYAYPFPDRYPLRQDDPDDCLEDPLPGRRGPTLLRGGLHASDGRGIAGATVQANNITNLYRTDASGQWVLWFPDGQSSGPVTVRVTMADGSALDVPGVCVVRGRENSLAGTALRGWVLRAGVGLPGATVAVSGRQDTTTTRADGGWSYYFGLTQPDETVSVTATLPNGDSRTEDGIAVRRRATVVVPTFVFP
jgi:hypothetical protein